MKTAISLPDDLFREIDACSKRLKMSRSRFLAVAARAFIARQQLPEDATAAWNRAIEEAGQPGDDEAAAAFRRRTRSVIGASARQW